jgi:hypothetical protein
MDLPLHVVVLILKILYHLLLIKHIVNESLQISRETLYIADFHQVIGSRRAEGLS